MLRTFLVIAIVVWMVGLGLRFDISALPLSFALAAIVLGAKHLFHCRSFN
jgi:hypothetical protein